MSAVGLRVEGRSFEHLDASELSAWNALHAAQGGAQWAFQSVGFSAAVHHTVAPVRVALLWQGDALVGVLSMQRQPGRLGRMGLHVPVGGVMADYTGLLARPGVQTCWETLLAGASIPYLYFTHLDKPQLLLGLDGEQPRTGLRTRIHPEGGAAHWRWLRQQNKKLVEDTDRRERKLEREHGPVVFAMDSFSAVQDLQWLIEAKNVQYQRTGASNGPLLDPRHQRLLAYLLAHPSQGCQPHLSVLKTGDEYVSCHFGLQSGSTLHYWFPVYNEALSAYSPGRVLFKNVILQSDTAGIDLIDRGEGNSAAKQDFATESHEFFRGAKIRGVRGHAVALAQRIIWRLNKK